MSLDEIEALLPCPVPWCQSDVLELIRSPFSRGYGVVCQNCRAQGPSNHSQAKAIAAWNCRDDAAARERDALAKECGRLAGEVSSLRASIADIHNSINIVGTPYDQAIKALDDIVSDVRKRARTALKARHDG